MRKTIKLAVAAAILAVPTNAYAMPEPVPSVWYRMMEWVMWNSAEHRPCNGSITRVCDGHL